MDGDELQRTEQRSYVQSRDTELGVTASVTII